MFQIWMNYNLNLLIKRKVYLQANIDWETTAYKFDSHINDFYYLFIHRPPNEV